MACKRIVSTLSQFCRGSVPATITIRYHSMKSLKFDPLPTIIIAICPGNAKVYKPLVIGVARIFDWGGANHESHAMTSSEISIEEFFAREKIL